MWIPLGTTIFLIIPRGRGDLEIAPTSIRGGDPGFLWGFWSPLFQKCFGELRTASENFGELVGHLNFLPIFQVVGAPRGVHPYPPYPPDPAAFSGGTAYLVAHLPHLFPRDYQFSDNQDSDRFLGCQEFSSVRHQPFLWYFCHMCHLCHTLTARFHTCGIYTTQPVTLLPAQNSLGDKRLHRIRGTCVILGQFVHSLSN